MNSYTEPVPHPEAVEIAQRLRRAACVALVGHVAPDADCLGAMTAVALALSRLGVRSRLVLPAGSVARRLDFLVRLAPDVGREGSCADCDVALALDAANPERLNLPQPDALRGLELINVDHHASNTLYGDWSWVDATASSTCEMAAGLIKVLGVELDATIATCLYAGLHADTQGFSLATATPRTFQVAWQLCHAGANVAGVCDALLRNLGEHEFALLRHVYEYTCFAHAGRLAWSRVSLSEMQRLGCTPSDVDNQVEVLRSVRGVQIAMLFTQAEPERVRVNLRGARGVQVLALAEQFGGGGHASSAGVRLRGSLEEAISRLTAAAERYLIGSAG